MTYHCGQQEDPAIALCAMYEDGDIVVPYEEIHSDTGRHFNCPACLEVIAEKSGGSARRPLPPPFPGVPSES